METQNDPPSRTGDILIVDDEVPNLHLLTQILSAAGYQVRPAREPQLAIDSTRARPPDLILLDVRMPEMDGFEVCQRLQQDDRTREVPIIFVSALQDVKDRVRGFELGGVDFISKPFQETEILARVRTHVALRKMTLHLEDLVAQRTAELTATNQALKTEIDERIRAEAALKNYRDRLKALASDLTITEERERRRIAEELHDGPLQTLAFARIRLANARRQSAGEQTKAMDEVSDSLRRASLDTSRVVSDLSSPAMQELGLYAAISDWTEEQIRGRFGIETKVVSYLEAVEGQKFDELTRTILFRNVRELLANVVKHAKATSVDVLLERAGDQLALTVRDDGQGCDPAMALDGESSEGGFGLFSIRERMSDLGGALEIESEPGQGFTATLLLPVSLDRRPAHG